MFVKDSTEHRPAPIKDIDLIAKRESRQRLQSFFSEHGWTIAAELLLLSEDRETYQSASKQYTIDLYYDYIDGNHVLHLRDRLSLDPVTISWTDLLLSKLQRVKLRAADVWDCCQLMKSKASTFDSNYYQKLMGGDWGLFTTVTDNLKSLSHKCSSDCADPLSNLLVAAEGAPKTMQWRTRAVAGRRIKWWKEVYEMKVSGGAD